MLQQIRAESQKDREQAERNRKKDREEAEYQRERDTANSEIFKQAMEYSKRVGKENRRRKTEKWEEMMRQ